MFQLDFNTSMSKKILETAVCYQQHMSEINARYMEDITKAYRLLFENDRTSVLSPFTTLCQYNEYIYHSWQSSFLFWTGLNRKENLEYRSDHEIRQYQPTVLHSDNVRHLRTLETITLTLIESSLRYAREVGEIWIASFLGEFSGLSRENQMAANLEKESIMPNQHDKLFESKQAALDEALSQIKKGGFQAALSRVGELLKESDKPLALDQLPVKKDLLKEYKRLLPKLSADEKERVREIQALLVESVREKALDTLPALLRTRANKDKMLKLFRLVEKEPEMLKAPLSSSQKSMFDLVKKTIENSMKSSKSEK